MYGACLALKVHRLPAHSDALTVGPPAGVSWGEPPAIKMQELAKR